MKNHAGDDARGQEKKCEIPMASIWKGWAGEGNKPVTARRVNALRSRAKDWPA